MITRVDTCLLNTCMRMILHCHGFLGIISRDVLKYFILSQRVAIFAVSCEPETRSLSVEIIRDGKIVLADLLDHVLIIRGSLFLFFLLLDRLSKYIVIAFTNVIYINNLLFDLVSCLIWVVDNLNLLFFIRVFKCHNILLSFANELLWVLCLYPAVFYILL